MSLEFQAEKLSYSEVVITLDFESSIRSSNLRRRTFFVSCFFSETVEKHSARGLYVIGVSKRDTSAGNDDDDDDGITSQRSSIED